METELKIKNIKYNQDSDLFLVETEGKVTLHVPNVSSNRHFQEIMYYIDNQDKLSAELKKVEKALEKHSSKAVKSPKEK